MAVNSIHWFILFFFCSLFSFLLFCMVYSAFNRNEHQESSWAKGGWCHHHLWANCLENVSLNNSLFHGPPRPLTGIALPSYFQWLYMSGMKKSQYPYIQQYINLYVGYIRLESRH
jgi:hypothetical protein